MALVKVDKLVEGVVLSKDVLDGNSRLLLAKGQAVGAQQIRILKTWGVFEVEVDGSEGEEPSNDPPLNSEAMQVVGEAIKTLFQAVDITHPAIAEIVRLSIEYRLKHGLIHAKPVEIPAVDADKSMNAAEILARIDRIDVKLPEVPSLVFELNEIISNPISSAQDIAKVIHKSPSLTATLLKIVNSAFYGLRSKIDSISRAVMLMGSKEVSSLAMGITIMELFHDIPPELMDVASFLEHSLACGVAARILAAQGNIVQTEQLFVAGMLHDIGRLILYKYFPTYAKLTFRVAVQSGQPLHKAEQKVLGCTHEHLGKKLLNKWKLPLVLVDNVFFHHHPSSAPTPAMASALQMADIIVHGMGVGNSAELIIPGFDTKAWERVSLPAGAFQSLIKQTEHQMETFRDILKKDKK